MMSSLSSWQVKDCDPGTGEPQAIAADPAGWVDLSLPGDLYLALHAAGKLPDPFYDQNEGECGWVGEREWWWRSSFTAPAAGDGERLILDCQGLDTFATLWLNGVLLGRSDNMFRGLRFDIGALVKSENTLLIRFDPASATVRHKQMELWPFIADGVQTSKRNFIRKAQFGWGWDWGPTLPTVGVWRPVELRLEQQGRLESIRFTTTAIAADRQQATARIEIAAERFAPTNDLNALITLTDPDGAEVAKRVVALPDGSADLALALDRPQLWWTPELGKPALYTLAVTLRDGAVELDSWTQKIGLRSIALDTSADPDEPGTSFFRFVLNGVPIFARGACWIPASSFVGALKAADYHRLVQAAAGANMNMLRIWGGGLYEHDAFYEACDEQGILVWQDFMFACAPYPEDEPDFIETIRQEIRHQVARLRHHACLALWCGNNECQAIQGVVNRLTGRQGKVPGTLYYDRIMPEIVAELDPATPYWPGSPTGGPSDNSMRAGDVHNWTVWHGIPPVPDAEPVGGFDHSPEAVAYTRYAEDKARFVSEFGIQASPALETLKRFVPADALELGSPSLLHRIKDKPKNKVDAMLVTVTGLPTNLQDYVDFTQITQAEGLKFGIEHYRRRKPHCSGTLIWQFNDCWSGVSWSVLDHEGFGKAGYFYVKRAYAPLLASFKQGDDGTVELWLTNDTAAEARGHAVIEFGSFRSGALRTETCAYAVPAGESRAAWQGSVEGKAEHYLNVHSNQDAFPANRLFFAPIKDLDRAAGPGPEVAIESVAADTLRVRLTAPRYLFFVHLLAPEGWTDFSDNYFDMRAGETRVIEVRAPGGTLDASDLRVASR